MTLTRREQDKPEVGLAADLVRVDLRRDGPARMTEEVQVEAASPCVTKPVAAQHSVG